MRAIKFKAKSIATGQWLFGFYRAVFENHEIIGFGGERYGVDPETVCQFTGFVDSEGAEVYEGDKTESKRVIVWRRGAFWSDMTEAEGKFPLTFIQEEQIDDTVTGNIHDK